MVFCSTSANSALFSAPLEQTVGKGFKKKKKKSSIFSLQKVKSMALQNVFKALRTH